MSDNNQKVERPLRSTAQEKRKQEKAAQELELQVEREQRFSVEMDLQRRIMQLQHSYMATDFKLSISSKSPKHQDLKSNCVLAVVTATRAVGTKNAQVFAHVLYWDAMANQIEEQRL